MMIKDRGNIKWQGMMLTEHVDLLNEFNKEYRSIKGPVLDEYELTLIAEEIERAFKSKSTIKLTYWLDGKLLDDYGVPIKIDTINKKLVIDDPFGTTTYSFDEIVAASLVD